MPVKLIQQSVSQSTAPVGQPPVPPPSPVVQPLLVPLPRRVAQVPPAPPERDEVEYPCEDGLPMASSPEQAEVMVDTRDALVNYFASRPNVYIGMDLLVFDKQGDNTSCLAPDVFVTFDVRRKVEKSYRIWLVGKPPDVVWEFGSDSTWKGDAKEKKARYRKWGVSEYWLYDPQGSLHNPRLQGFQLVKGRYRRLLAERRGDGLLVVKSPLLGLEQHFDGQRLRFWDPVANEYLNTIREAEQGRLRERKGRLKAEAGEERQRKERLEAQAGEARERQGRLKAEAGEERERQGRLEAEAELERERKRRLEAESRAESGAQAQRESEARSVATEARSAEFEASGSTIRK